MDTPQQHQQTVSLETIDHFHYNRRMSIGQGHQEKFFVIMVGKIGGPGADFSPLTALRFVVCAERSPPVCEPVAAGAHRALAFGS